MDIRIWDCKIEPVKVEMSEILAMAISSVQYHCPEVQNCELLFILSMVAISALTGLAGGVVSAIKCES